MIPATFSFRDSCLPANPNEVVTQPAQLGSSRTASHLLLLASRIPSATPATVSGLTSKVLVSGQLSRAPYLSFPSVFSCQPLQSTPSPLGWQGRIWGVMTALGQRAAQGSLPLPSCHQNVSPLQVWLQQQSFLISAHVTLSIKHFVTRCMRARVLNPILLYIQVHVLLIYSCSREHLPS